MPDIDKTIFTTLLPENACILDIGSYDGKDAVELADVLNTEVHCFEPDIDSFAKIKARKDDRLICWKYAVGAWHGKGPFVKSPNHPQSNSMHAPLKHTKVFPKVKFSKRSYMVECTTLDNWHRSVMLGKQVDLIWIDVNGSEGDVIKGATAVLKMTKYLYIEFQEVELYKGAMNREKTLLRLPDFEMVGEYNFEGNYGNLLLRNKNIE